jgi:hypothetical protein
MAAGAGGLDARGPDACGLTVPGGAVVQGSTGMGM